MIAGTVGLCTSKDSWISRVICWFRSSQWSHCFVVLGEWYGEIMIGEASELGVVVCPLRKYLRRGTRLELWRVAAKSYDIEWAINHILQLTGRRYGYLQLIGFIWIWINNLLGIKKSNPFDDGIICSEYVYYYLKKLDLNLNDFDENSTAPDDIWNILMSSGAELVAASDYDSEELEFIK